MTTIFGNINCAPSDPRFSNVYKTSILSKNELLLQSKKISLGSKNAQGGISSSETKTTISYEDIAAVLGVETQKCNNFARDELVENRSFRIQKSKVMDSFDTKTYSPILSLEYNTEVPLEEDEKTIKYKIMAGTEYVIHEIERKQDWEYQNPLNPSTKQWNNVNVAFIITNKEQEGKMSFYNKDDPDQATFVDVNYSDVSPDNGLNFSEHDDYYGPRLYLFIPQLGPSSSDIDVGWNDDLGTIGYQTSSIEFKEEVQEIPEGALALMDNIQIPFWRWKETKKPSVGPIIEHMAEVFGNNEHLKNLSFSGKAFKSTNILFMFVERQRRLINQQNLLIQDILGRLAVLENQP